MIPDRALTPVQHTIVTRLLDGPATTREIRALLPTSGPESVRGSLRILARQGRVETIGHRWSTPDPATWALTPRYEARVRHGMTRLGPGLRTMLVLLDRAPEPVSIAELRAALGMTIAVVRRLMDHARRDPALVTATRLAPAWGRPAQGWSITDEGRQLLHDRERLRAREAET
jgi:hypothetical protein